MPFSKTTFLFSALVVLVVGTTSADAATLAGHWALDDGAGAAAVDSGPQGMDAVIGGTYAWVPGIVGDGVELTGFYSGTDGWIDAPNVFGPLSTGDITISAWIKKLGNQNFTVLFSQKSATNGQISINHDERAAYAGQRGGFRDDTSWDQAEDTGYVLDIGTWHHVVLGRDSATSKVYLYRDNVLVAEADSTPRDLGITDEAMTWGNAGLLEGGIEHNFGATAVLDELQCYNGWIGASGVDYLYNNPGEVVVPEPGMAIMLFAGVICFLFGNPRRRSR